MAGSLNRVQNESRSVFAQTIDIPATILAYFGVTIPEDIFSLNYRRFGKKLYDCSSDCYQECLLVDEVQEFRLIQNMKQMMVENDAPVLGLG